MHSTITRDDITDEASTRLADADHLIAEVADRIAKGATPHGLIYEYQRQHRYLLAFIADSALRAQERLDEDTPDDIPEAPEDSDIGRFSANCDKVAASIQEPAPERLQQTAPIGHYICPTCGRGYEGDDLPSTEELIGWLMSGHCCNACVEEAEQPNDPEWRVEWSCDITAPTAWDAALIAQQMMQDPENTAGCFDVLPWRNGEVHREEGVSVDLNDQQSDVPPTLPDDADWVPGQ